MHAPGTVFLVFNTGSGRTDRRAALDEIERSLQKTQRPYQVVKIARGAELPSAAARAAERAAQCGGILAAAGGDGTLNGVAQAAFHADVAFGAVPLGTFNYFAREKGLPLDPGEAARVLAEGAAQPVQVGLINERIFLVNASLGLYPRLLEDREAFKGRYGRTRWVAMLAALWTVLARTQPRIVLRIAQAGSVREVRASTLFVGNNPLQLSRLGIEQAQAVEAGQLAAIRVRPVSLWGLLDMILYGAVGRLGQSAGVEAFSFREMTVTTLRQRRRDVFLKVATDGESVRMKLPLVFRVAPRPLRLLQPPRAP